MDRNYQFEITYIITLTISTLGFVTGENVNSYVNLSLAYFFLILVALHTILFNISYTFDNAVQFDISFASRLREASRWTLLSITILFLFLVVHIMGYVGSDLFYSCNNLDNRSCTITNSFMRYGIPIITTGITMVPLKDKLLSALLLRNVDILAEPSHIRVFSRAEDTEPLFVKVSNNSKKVQEFKIKVEVPENVCWETPDQGPSHADFSKEVSLKPNYRDVVDMQLEYTGEERGASILYVSVEHNIGSYEKEVQLSLFPE